MSLATLFAAIREEAGAGAWSRGVELARGDGVSGVNENDDVITLRVALRGGLVAPTVLLYPEDEEWDCDCSSPEDPCIHVAAAVIALKRARDAGEELPGTGDAAPGRVVYHLRRQGRALEFSRVIASADSEVPLRSSLVSIASERIDGPLFAATEVDRRVERILGRRMEGALPAPVLTSVLRRLVDCDDVRLDGEPVAVSSDAVLPVVRVEDAGDGFVVTLGPDPDVSEVFSNGIALCGRTLRPIGEDRITLRERETLPRGRYFGPDEVASLVSAVLPSLRERTRIDLRTERLPGTERIAPRLRVTVHREGDALHARTQVVYGDPVQARVEAGRLVHEQGALPVRDPKAEQRLFDRALRELELPPEREVRLAPEAAIGLGSRLRETEHDVLGTAWTDFYDAGTLEPELSLDPGAFSLDFTSEGASRNKGRASGDAVLRAFAEGRSLVSLMDGGFGRIPEDFLAGSGALVADLLAARTPSGALPPALLPDLARLCEALDAPAPPGFDRLRALVHDFEGLAEPELPDDLTATLRPYQTRGIAWLQFLRGAELGGLLADDMGLGKTLQALCAIHGRTLVVCPTSVLYGWREQMAQFRPGLRVHVYHGPRRTLDPDADVTLTTYALLRGDIDLLEAESWDTVVLDEAQAIKNPDSQVAGAAHRLNAGFRMTLTGTPVENRLDELWSQIHFANPGLLGGRTDFRRRYATPIAEGDADALAYLRLRIRPFVLRRLKGDVAPELPPRTECVLHCELSESETEVYDAIRAAARKDVVEKLRAGGNVLEALEALLRLRQAACHAALVPGQTAESSSKLDLLVETLDEAVSEGHKALVFSQWTSLLDRVEPALRTAGLPFTRLDGTTRDRGAVVEQFQSDDGPPVLLISLRAGGTGLNLTAADHVYLLDPWWNPAVEAQAADRAHRIGQEKPVMVYRLVARGTVEERILALQDSKRELAEAALGGSDAAAGITRDELLALLD